MSSPAFGKGTIRRAPCPVTNIAAVIGNLPSAKPHVVYYRSRNAARGVTIEYFSVGAFEILEMPWNSADTDRWRHVERGMLRWEQLQQPLAGYIAYETGFVFEKRWQQLNVPQTGYAYRFMRVPCWYEREQGSGEAWLCWTDDCGTTALKILEDALTAGTEDGQSSTVTHNSIFSIDINRVAATGELCGEEYCDLVDRAKTDIFAGRYYELNLTQRFRVSSVISPMSAFSRILHNLNPAQAFLAVFPDEVICSASPEVFLQKWGSAVVTRPIKGSYGDECIITEKLHAEHTMVVDLARNDLGRISDMAPVTVSAFRETERFGFNDHFVSTVCAETSAPLNAILRATLPAASITGAPKVEVVNAIGELEVSPRGVYTGTCGLIMPDGDLDLNVAIRTLHAVRGVDNTWQYEFGSGGAIVADSDPESEYQECLMKALPLLSVLFTPE